MKIIKKHIISFFIAFFIASIFYLGGAFFNASFNLKEWTEGSKFIVSCSASITLVIMYLNIMLPILKYIKYIFQIILAVLLTIIWLIPTILIYIFYFIFASIWHFKIKTYVINKVYKRWNDDSIVIDLLWSDIQVEYKTYFHAIWNITDNNTPLLLFKTNKYFKHLIKF